MGKQHHLSKRKGYDQLVSAILQKTEKHKKIEFELEKEVKDFEVYDDIHTSKRKKDQF